MAQGGYQAPGSPAPVSGPGRLSQRTDGGPADKDAMKLTGGGKYGESKELAEIQGGAPMEAKPEPGLARWQGPGLGDPSARPDEPVTFGADAGEGPGSDVLGIPDADQGDIQALLVYLPVLEFMANRPNASPSTRAVVRRMKSKI